MQGQSSNTNSYTNTFYFDHGLNANNLGLVRNNIVPVNSLGHQGPTSIDWMGQSSSTPSTQTHVNLEESSQERGWFTNGPSVLQGSSSFPFQLTIDLNVTYDDSDGAIGPDLESETVGYNRRAPEEVIGLVPHRGYLSSTQEVENSAIQGMSAPGNSSMSLNMYMPSNNLSNPSQPDQITPGLGFEMLGAESYMQGTSSVAVNIENFQRNARPRRAADYPDVLPNQPPVVSPLNLHSDVLGNVASTSQSGFGMGVQSFGHPSHNLADMFTEVAGNGAFPPIPSELQPIDAARRRAILVSEVRQALELLHSLEASQDEDVRVVSRAEFYGEPEEEEEDDEEEDEEPDLFDGMRLDVDDMTYEEMLALEEQIGNVSTGLSQDAIFARMRRRRYRSVKKGPQVDEESCCICQDEYINGQGLGILDCGHDFHFNCIKQWLMQKNSCPICKKTALAD